MNNFPTATNTNNRKKKNYFATFLFFSTLMIVLVLYLVLNVRIYRTQGHSMLPTIDEGSIAICLKNTTIHRNDIIAFDKSNEVRIKRVIGMPNEVLELAADGKQLLYTKEIDDEVEVDFYINEYDVFFPHKIEENHYFVLGDNRENSLDSRYRAIGDISIDEIICEIKIVL
jgi:signal peptidase I